MKKMRHSKLALHRETLQKLSSDNLSQVNGGVSLANCSVNCGGSRACGGTANCPAESNNCQTTSAGCNVT